MDNKQTENDLLRPDHELPAPHDMLIEAEEKDGIPINGGTTVPNSYKPSQPAKSRSFPLWILPLIAFLLVLLAGGMYFMNMQKSSQQPVTQTNIPSPTITATPDPMAGWILYNTGEFSFKYPPSAIVSAINTETVLELIPDTGSSSAQEISFSKTIKRSSLTLQQYAESEFMKAFKRNVTTSQLTETIVNNIPGYTYVLQEMGATSQILLLEQNSTNVIGINVTSIDSYGNLNKEIIENILSTFKFTMANASPAASPSTSESMTMCTMDAKICPDGSSVGRTGPNCTFAACPK